MDVFYAYTYGTAAWLGLKGLALVSGPRLIVTLLLDESRVTPSDAYSGLELSSKPIG